MLPDHSTSLSPIAPKRTQASTILAEARANRRIYSLDLRSRCHVGNPSQRIAELEALGHIFSRERYRSNSGARGMCWTLIHDAGNGTQPAQRVEPARPNTDRPAPATSASERETDTRRGNTGSSGPAAHPPSDANAMPRLFEVAPTTDPYEVAA